MRQLLRKHTGSEETARHVLRSLLGDPGDNPGRWRHSHIMFQEGRSVTVWLGTNRAFCLKSD